MEECRVCFRHCVLSEGQVGACGARACRGGRIVSENYGKLSSIALDPIEKKPLHRFHSGSKIVSLGGYGCNLRCPFCQNHEISWSENARLCINETQIITSEEILRIAERYRPQGNIGVAFTYNEPLIGYEFVRDTARLVHESGMVNVLVTNGTAELWVLEELTPYIDAMNIDLKCFSAKHYSKTLGGDFDMVTAFIKRAVQICHVELTTLIVPGMNDSDDEMRQISGWISELADRSGKPVGRSIPLHISRFFPRFKMTDRKATDIGLVYHLADIAREKLDYVYTGNC